MTPRRSWPASRQLSAHCSNSVSAPRIQQLNGVVMGVAIKSGGTDFDLGRVARRARFSRLASEPPGNRLDRGAAAPAQPEPWRVTAVRPGTVGGARAVMAGSRKARKD